jgi:hypothetical protein
MTQVFVILLFKNEVQAGPSSSAVSLKRALPLTAGEGGSKKKKKEDKEAEPARPKSSSNLVATVSLKRLSSLPSTSGQARPEKKEKPVSEFHFFFFFKFCDVCILHHSFHIPTTDTTSPFSHFRKKVEPLAPPLRRLPKPPSRRLLDKLVRKRRRNRSVNFI